MSPPPPPHSSQSPLTANNLPALSTYATVSRNDQTSALKLIADSIAQQRQLAARALLTHPLSLSLFALLAALLWSFWSFFFGIAGDGKARVDKTMALTTAGGVVMAGLVGVRAFTSKYLERAERVGWEWLFEGSEKRERAKMEVKRGEEEDKGEEDNEEEEKEVKVVVVVTVWDEKVIATVVMNVDRPQRKAVVRAWTTLLKYRGVGIGKGVLEEAVRVAVKKYGCRKVEFAGDHASEFFSSLFSCSLFFLLSQLSQVVFSLLFQRNGTILSQFVQCPGPKCSDSVFFARKWKGKANIRKEQEQTYPIFTPPPYPFHIVYILNPQLSVLRFQSHISKETHLPTLPLSVCPLPPPFFSFLVSFFFFLRDFSPSPSSKPPQNQKSQPLFLIFFSRFPPHPPPDLQQRVSP